MTTFEQLEPKEVFNHFAALSAIPRGSQNEKQVSDYIVTFASARGLEARQDKMYNVLVKKPGTLGYENAPVLILHGHMDMVCEKDPGVEHDFAKDGIKLVIDGDYIRADGTSLGADNGIGCAFILALLDSKDIAHPPLEAVMTVMEEMGKVGASEFDVSQLEGTRMVDFNWVTDEQILAGCAGDISGVLTVDAEWVTTPTDTQALSLSIGGLLGGHCEFDIHLERANGIVVLARVLNSLAKTYEVQIASFEGGAQNNVIPAHGELVIVIQQADKAPILEAIKKLEATLKSEFSVADPGLTLTVTEAELPSRVFSRTATRRAGRIAVLLPNGVISMSRSIDGLVESSSNLGTVRATDDGLAFTCTITAGVSSRKHDIFERMRALAEIAGGRTEFEQFGLDAPEFPPISNSKSVPAAVAAFKAVHGREPEVLVSSCSLELGFFVKRIPNLDTVGIGTELLHLHSTKECVSHPSVARSWKVIREFVSGLKD
ncbi:MULTISPECIES: beta-Ala-His dipeptidase [Rhizobium/Agrobacterium group]|uniref:beta-Ala-His dipeptidase n=1 Tax=Rhizobium/Agrobacterium group TaxID=227290 RepID=UPI001436A1BC|nr:MULTISPECIES: beta-Ala-His dipeptidase [Rhizobium/Agrobacterium group]MBB4403054.1 dipeptidase D [Agrobacterium radiobacter]MBB5589036.1 dipeptidase D [Agrobacterium radiobacter]